jgi:hypothetical protein
MHGLFTHSCICIATLACNTLEHLLDTGSDAEAPLGGCIQNGKNQKDTSGETETVSPRKRKEIKFFFKSVSKLVV